MHFGKQDLVFTNYRWDSDKKRADALFSGQPSRRIFDPSNGDQVLFLINFCGSTDENFTIKEGRTIEWHIANKLPVEIKSEISVFYWIQNNVDLPAKTPVLS